MNLLRTLIGPVWVLDAVLSADGSHTLTAWRCRPGHVPEPAACDPAAVAGGVAVVTVRGHGVVTKPLAAETVIARVRAEGGTFLLSEAEDEVSFVRRERVHPVLSELERNGIRPQFVGVALSPEAAAEAFRKALRWRLLLRLTPEGSVLARTAVRRTGPLLLGLFFCLLAANAVFSPRLEARRQRLQAQLEVRERSASTAAAAGVRQRELEAAFLARPIASYAVVGDRIGGAVPRRVVLTRLEIEPLAGRFEAGKPLLRRERRAVAEGTAPVAADITEFVQALSALGCCRRVQVTHVERERDGERLIFKLEAEL